MVDRAIRCVAAGGQFSGGKRLDQAREAGEKERCNGEYGRESVCDLTHFKVPLILLRTSLT
jgi:hypothetical protein